MLLSLSRVHQFNALIRGACSLAANHRCYCCYATISPHAMNVADCLSSALALNCCQFAFLKQHKNSSSHIGANKNDWMCKLNANKKLRDVVLPGTHNSASSTISKWSLFSGVAICQNLSIYQQLNAGARYLDVRVCSHKNDIMTCHGIVKGGKLADVLDEVEVFLCDNPKEFIIFEIKDEAPMTSSQKHQVLHLVQSTFRERMITSDDMQTWFQLKHVTIGDIRRRQKNILILIQNSFCSHDKGMHLIAKEYSCFHNNTLMHDKWHNTTNSGDLLDRNLTHLRLFSRYDREHMICNQLVLTPQPPSNMLDAVCHLFGLKSLQPISLVKQLYQKEEVLHCFISDRPDLHWNIISLDFIDLCPQFVNFLIEMNSSRSNT